LSTAKAQAAMEFLMTYGWVVVLVLVTIGVLNYFGVFGIQGLIPEKCELGPGLQCVDYHISEGAATLVVQNTLGKEITITGLSISKKDDPTSICSSSLNEEVASGARATLTCQVQTPFKAYGKERFIPTIAFTMSGEEFSIKGEVYTAPRKTVSPALQQTEKAFAFSQAPGGQQQACTPKAAAEDPNATCWDGTDNDCDGMMDCNDPDCSSDSLCSPK